MTIDKLELLEQVNSNWAPTNTIAKRIKANWHVVFGLLCILYKEDYVEYQEVQLSGKRKTMLWRRLVEVKEQ